MRVVLTSIFTVATAASVNTSAYTTPDDADYVDDPYYDPYSYSTPHNVYNRPADYDPNALLGSSNGGWAVWDFCYGKPDETELPEDPRSFIQEGVSDGKAVHFNAYWKNCHVDPEAVQEVGAATTCGELRERFDAGENLLTGGAPGVGALFAGNDPFTAEAAGGISTMTPGQYNDLWKSWGGYVAKPRNYDQLVAERYGSVLPEKRNPYPLKGEDPNRTNGGSGQLPLMLTQMRYPDGTWTGRIGVTCHACHSGAIDGQPALGGGSPLADLDLFLRDGLAQGYLASIATLANLTHTRGTNNASDVNLAFIFPDEGFYTPRDAIDLITSGSTASMDTPAWWNLGHRPVKFVDGLFPADAPRVDQVFYTPIFGLFGELLGPLSEAGQDYMRENGPPINSWIETLKSPQYPGEIDVALAEEGAVLFHELDMWAPERNNTVRRPEGNGSCAGCHGAYAPRYVNDPEFLASPVLEGIASYIVPQEIIGTDSVRWETNNEGMQRAGSVNFFGYPPTKGTDQDCGPQNQERLRGDRELGYQAPPLYGVWATAPYFHNGSVPNVWEILKPSDRKPLWRRKSNPKIENPWYNNGKVVAGYDTRLDTAYDAEKMGWQYDEIACEWRSWLNPTVAPYRTCDPNDPNSTPMAQKVLEGLYGNLILTWNIFYPPTLTMSQIEDHKIFNTLLFSHGNEGHEFNSVLTDHERLAIIEYLKTL
ncbi:hypothetical protein [uncultured Microbulbifer sp.]|uniref:rubber dioxygenase RoxB n=1 Tax=uncultured Microbulbifer sp. TaxID=348147 RepID=UPI0025FAE38D|nr:hypothetical protein [uncultured Microbulbifer sp.]